MFIHVFVSILCFIGSQQIISMFVKGDYKDLQYRPEQNVLGMVKLILKGTFIGHSHIDTILKYCLVFSFISLSSSNLK